jgi:DNA invertase Pin-like site-specific DNA recombinase
MKPKQNNIVALYIQKARKIKSKEQHENYLCLTEAKKRGFEVKGEFLYQETSPTKKLHEREEIKSLIEDAKKELFSTVIFFSLTRAAGDYNKAVVLKKFLEEELGIRVISLLERYDSHFFKGDDTTFFEMMYAMQNPDLLLSPELKRLV